MLALRSYAKVDLSGSSSEKVLAVGKKFQTPYFFVVCPDSD
jgi:hypothetical protein